MSDFYPISPLVGITNTSYGAQAGVLNEMWAVRVVHGRKIIAEKTIPCLELDNIVGVAYGHIRVEGLSRHAVAAMAGRLMQYARKYQESGVCPNYELAEFTYDDGSTAGAQTASSGGSSEGASPEVAATATLPDLRVAEVPQIPRTIGDAAWQQLIEAHAALIYEVSAYAKSLPTGHLETMFSKAADQLIHFWVTSNPADQSAVLKGFGALIQSCSKESQLPNTSTGSATIETGTCELLRICRLLDPNMSMMPAGYPCTFHEMIAKKISVLSGIKVSVNTSSIGCIVGMSVESSVF
ncbi:MAG: hypothetical protein C4K48_03910 [Candidatus Thorarchaeota archaeon]|nr:MAG: hypothetical protein C4K48_03910 [Candidatus Thorarchaeota archaeon]